MSEMNNTEIKPIWAREVNRYSADAHKCAGCGSNLYFEPSMKALVCNHCGGIYNAKTLAAIAESKNYDEGELTSKEEEKHEILCNSCGAQIVADKNTSATICPFCGSPALIINRLSRKFEPDYIIPFKYGKEEAKKAFLRWGKSNKFIERGFVSHKNIESITGIYVPFWLVDAECHMEIEGTGYSLTGKDRVTTIKVERECTLNYEKIPFDGSQKWQDSLMEAIEPFDYSDMKPYLESQGYISGFMAERYDLPYIRISRRIVGRIKRYIKEEANSMVMDYDKFRILEDRSTVEKMDFHYCLAPIWFVNYNYEGETYQFVMNGQTGAVAGDVPISRAKKNLFKLSIILLTIITVGVLLGLNGLLIYLAIKKISAALFIFEAAVMFLSIELLKFMFIFEYFFLKDFEYQRDLNDAKPKSSQYIRNTRYSDLKKKDVETYMVENPVFRTDILWEKKHSHLQDNKPLYQTLEVYRASERRAQERALSSGKSDYFFDKPWEPMI
ncbi:MAG: hypothetical protein MJ172_09130 [Clostridia bacterium]|nr:hypothetical protein [Clostridia bacterium]